MQLLPIKKSFKYKKIIIKKYAQHHINTNVRTFLNISYKYTGLLGLMYAYFNLLKY